MSDGVNQEIGVKFNLLLSKLEDANIKIREAAKSIQNNLIPVFEKSLADLQLAVDRLVDKNSQMQTRFEQQTDFLIKNLMDSVDSIKIIFDINKLEDIVEKTDKITETLSEELQKIDIPSIFKELKTALNKLK